MRPILEHSLPIANQFGLHFRFKDKPGIAAPGKLATRDEIVAESNKLKGDQSLAQKGHRACGPITNLELDDDAIDNLIGAPEPERDLSQAPEVLPQPR